MTTNSLITRLLRSKRYTKISVTESTTDKSLVGEWVTFKPKKDTRPVMTFTYRITSIKHGSRKTDYALYEFDDICWDLILDIDRYDGKMRIKHNDNKTKRRIDIRDYDVKIIPTVWM